MVDGSNASLYYPNEELDHNLRTGTPWLKNFKQWMCLPLASYAEQQGEDWRREAKYNEVTQRHQFYTDVAQDDG